MVLLMEFRLTLAHLHGCAASLAVTGIKKPQIIFNDSVLLINFT